MAIARPLTQTVIICLICAIVIIGAVVYVHGTIFSDSTSTKDALTVENAAAQDQPISTSTDWKKSFIDGSVDITKNVQKAPSAAAANTPDTLTMALGKQALIGYVALNQSGSLDNSDSVDAAVKGMVDSTLGSQAPKTYTSANLKLTAASDPASLQQFAASVSRALYLYSATKNEALITRDSLQNSDPSGMKKVANIATNYQQIINALLAIQTPQAMSKDMVPLINGFSSMKFVAESLSVASTDPVKGMVGVGGYIDSLDSLITALRNMRDDLQAQGVALDFNQNMVVTMLAYN